MRNRKALTAVVQIPARHMALAVLQAALTKEDRLLRLHQAIAAVLHEAAMATHPGESTPDVAHLEVARTLHLQEVNQAVVVAHTLHLQAVVAEEEAHFPVAEAAAHLPVAEAEAVAADVNSKYILSVLVT